MGFLLANSLGDSLAVLFDESIRLNAVTDLRYLSFRANLSMIYGCYMDKNILSEIKNIKDEKKSRFMYILK